jgi:hypothetical protein
VGLRDLVVLAVVTDEILGTGTVEDIAELFGLLQMALISTPNHSNS